MLQRRQRRGPRPERSAVSMGVRNYVRVLAVWVAVLAALFALQEFFT
jgi:hypothetical protein